MKTETFMSIAEAISKESYANRKKVGCILELNGRIISTGYNGTSPGADNKCEEDDETKVEVIHAEFNAIGFATRTGISTDQCSLYITLSPCMECAKLIICSGIINVYYMEEYRDPRAIDFLKLNNINCIKIGKDNVC